MAVVFWLVSLALGFGFTKFVQLLQSVALQPSPSSPVFMLISLLLVTVVFQAHVNVARGWPRSARFTFAPPDATILLEVAAFFAGSVFAIGGLKGFQ